MAGETKEEAHMEWVTPEEDEACKEAPEEQEGSLSEDSDEEGA
jgi:hypothetical protein